MMIPLFRFARSRGCPPLFRLAVLGIAVACALPAGAQSASQPAGWQTIFTDDFERTGLGPNWQMTVLDDPAASWNIVKDGSNPVLAGQGHSFLYLWAGDWADYRFKTRVKLVQNGGVNLNFRNANCTRYFIPFNPGGLGLSRTLPCGTHTPLAQAPGSYQLNQWYTVEIVGVGPNVKVYVDGVLKIDFTDDNPVLFGRAAFEPTSQGQIYFDDVEISGPATSAVIQKLTWTKVGGPQGGVGYDERMRPDNPDVMLVTDTSSGVNLSTDGGRTWTASNTGITTRTGQSGDAIPVFCLAMDPNNSDVVWAGTQNARGIFRSVDGGKTWTQRTNGIVEQNGISFRGISVDPRDSNTVYAAAEISSFTWAGQSIKGLEFDLVKGVVYRTRDGGQNWAAIWRGDNLARYVVVDPRDSNVLYVSTGIFDREAANSDMIHGIPGGVGIVKTTDGGQTWQVLNQANGLPNLYVGTLAMHPQNPDILLAGTGGANYSTGAGIYLSTDRGATWRKGTVVSNQPVPQEIINSVKFAPSNPSIAYAGSYGSFYRSTDGGVTWTIRAGGPPNMYYGPPGIRTGHPIDLAIDPRDPNRIFINDYGGGNYMSTDGGLTWQTASKGYTGAVLVKIALDPSDSGNLFSAGKSGAFHTPDRGDTWIGLLNGPATAEFMYSIAVNPGSPTTVLVADEFSGYLYRSTDNGLNWKTVNHIPEITGSPGARGGFKALAFAPSNPQIVYAGTCRDQETVDAGNPPAAFGIFKSIDGGISWMPSNDSTSTGQNVNVLLADPHDANTVYAGTVTGGVLKSVDGGATWKPSNRGLKLQDVRSLAFDPGNTGVIYAGIERGGLYKSADSGDTWQDSGVGMDPQATVRAIVADPTNPAILYAADLTTGVYRSDNRGGLWIAINKGLSTRAVNTLAIASDGSMLYAGTWGEGLFRMDLFSQNGREISLTSAATYQPGADLAQLSIATAFGSGLADTLTVAPPGALPTAIADISLSVTDASGAERLAPLYFVSPGQINLLVPAGLAAGPAVFRVFQQGNVIARGSASIEPVAPGLFTANADGKGVPAAIALHAHADGTQDWDYVFRCGAAAGSCAASTIELGSPSDQVILELFGTGIRGESGGVTAQIGGEAAQVMSASAQGQFDGLDQVNILLPHSLVGRGNVDVLLRVDGKAANTVSIRVN